MRYMNDTDGTTRLAYRVAEVQAKLGLGRNKVYELVSSGELGSVKAGKAILIPKEALDKYLTVG